MAETTSSRSWHQSWPDLFRAWRRNLSLGSYSGLRGPWYMRVNHSGIALTGSLQSAGCICRRMRQPKRRRGNVTSGHCLWLCCASGSLNRNLQAPTWLCTCWNGRKLQGCQAGQDNLAYQEKAYLGLFTCASKDRLALGCMRPQHQVGANGVPELQCNPLVASLAFTGRQLVRSNFTWYRQGLRGQSPVLASVRHIVVVLICSSTWADSEGRHEAVPEIVLGLRTHTSAVRGNC